MRTDNQVHNTYLYTYVFCLYIHILDLVSVAYLLPLQVDQHQTKIVVTFRTLIFLMHME